MDQATLVNEKIDDGKQLYDALASDGFDIRLAFWGRSIEDEKWYLHLASPVVDENGPRDVFRRVNDTLRKMPDLWIDPFDIKVVGMRDSLAEAALAVWEPRIPDSPFAVPNPKRYGSICRVEGSTKFERLGIDSACIYPPRRVPTSLLQSNLVQPAS
jgi:hypothetical protein